MAPFTIWEKNNNIKKAFKIMKAVDEVGGLRGWEEKADLWKFDGFQRGTLGTFMGATFSLMLMNWWRGQMLRRLKSSGQYNG